MERNQSNASISENGGVLPMVANPRAGGAEARGFRTCLLSPLGFGGDAHIQQGQSHLVESASQRAGSLHLWL